MKYTAQENVRIVIALLKEYNIRHVVLSPGGTNVPVVQALQDDDFFKCYSIPDERSAMYFAIGLYLQTGEIIATSCTSAQATRNYVPGLTEAFYKHVPILAITTSKLERFQYQEYMQAPDQCSLPKDAVKKSFDLPPVTDENTRIQVLQSANEAFLTLTHHGYGPVQLNLRIVDSQIREFNDDPLPVVQKIERFMAWDDWDKSCLQNKKILIVVGEHRPFTKKQSEAIESFCDSYNAAVYVTHLSNYNGRFAIDGHYALSVKGKATIVPDLLITIGGQTGDYTMFYAGNGFTNCEHWRIAEDGEVVDTYCKLTRIFEVPDWYFFDRMKCNQKVDHTYYETWNNLVKAVSVDKEIPFSNTYVAQKLHKLIPDGSIMNFAILNSLRVWSCFPLPPKCQCYANIAAFGIDGCNSMLIGESMNTEALSFIVTGDLAFFYDMNALGIRQIKNNVRILLINNKGGAEFHFMTSSWSTPVDVTRYIAAEGHNGNAKGWAENCGFEYLSAKDEDSLSKVINQFVSSSLKPILLEVFTDSDIDTAAIKKLKSSTDIPVKNIKSMIAGILGPSGVTIAKKIISHVK